MGYQIFTQDKKLFVRVNAIMIPSIPEAQQDLPEQPENIMHFHWAELWPVVIIGAGGMMIWNSIIGQRRRKEFPDTAATMNAHATPRTMIGSLTSR